MEQAGVQLVAQGASALGTDMASATKAVDGFVGATVGADGKLRDAQGRFVAMGGTAQATGRQVQDAGGGFNAFGEIAIGAMRRVGAVVVDVMGQALKATVGFVKDSIGAAGDFEAGMNKFQVVAGKGVDTRGLKQFRDLFIQLGRELPVSTTEVEDAATEMISGGIDPAIVAAGGLRQTLNFAAASGLSLADAAQTSAKFLAGWTDSAATADEQVAFLTLSTDTLTKAAAASSTTAAELRLGLFNVQGAAQELHVSFEDTTATLAKLAPAFQSSAQAGTALSVFMTRLVPSTKPALAVMQDLGIVLENGQNTFFDTKGNFLGMANAAEVLKTKLAGMSDAQKIANLHTLFGDDAQKVANLLMQDGAAGLDAMRAKMDEANGVAAAAALMQEGYSVAVKNAQGSVEALQITIGSALLPVLTDLMNNVIAPAVNTFTDMADAVFGSDDAFNRLSPSAQAIVSILDVLIADTQEIIGAFNESGAASAAFATRIGELASDLGLPGGAITSIVEATQVLVASFQDGGDAASELGGVVKDLNGIWDTALTTVEDVASGYQAVFQATLPIVTKFWTDHGTEISAFVKSTYDSIIAIVNGALKLYDAVVTTELRAATAFFTEHATGIQSVLSGAYHVLEGIVTGGLALISGAISVALDVIHGDWSQAWADIKTMSATFVTALGTTIKGGLEVIAGFFDTSLADIGATWQHNWDALIEVASKIGARMVVAGKSMVEGVIKGVEDEASELYQALIDMGRRAFDEFMKGIAGGSPALEFVPGGESVIQGIMLGMQNMLPGLMGVVDGVGSALKDQFKKVSDETARQIDDMVDGIQDQIRQAQEDLTSLTVSGFTSTASISRQVADNLGKFKESVKPGDEQSVANQLKAAEQQARAMQDPAQGAAYFKQQSNQIFELAAMRKDAAEQQQAIFDDGQKQAEAAAKIDAQRSLLAVAATEDERTAILAKIKALNAEADAQMSARHAAQANLDTLTQQIAYISAAQSDEDKAADLVRATTANPFTELANTIRDIMNTTITAGGKSASMPPVLDDALRGLNNYINQLTSPPASGQQIASRAQYTTNYNNNSYNLGMQTNMTQTAVQQSFAILQAMNP